jgi:hypothetical protein
MNTETSNQGHHGKGTREHERTGRDEPTGVVIHTCMETTQGNSLCSYLSLKLAKTPCFSFSFMFFILQNQRTGGQNRWWWWFDTGGRGEVMGKEVGG